MRRPQPATRAVLIAAALVVAACSGSGGSSSATESIDDAPATATTPIGGDEGAASESGPEPGIEPAIEPGDDVDGAGSMTEPESEAPTADSEGPPTRYATGDSSFLFDPSVVHTFDIGLEPEALAQLDSDPAAEEYVEGSLTFDGETLERVGVRYKGSVGAFLGCTAGLDPFDPSGPRTCTKLSMKLKINWDGADTEFYGQRRVQLHSANLDQSLLRDRLGYEMFSQAGVPSPRASHARVEINGELVGVFVLVEQIDGRFTRDRFEDGTGNLYKEMWPFDEFGQVRSHDELIGSLRTNENEDPNADIVRSFAQEIVDAGAALDPDAARRVLEARTDLDALIAYSVVDRAIRNDDGPFHWYCIDGTCEPHNFYVYEDPSSERVHVIPWDLDNSLRRSGGITGVTEIGDGWGEISNDCEPFPFGPLDLLQRSAACDPFVAAWASLDTEFAAADAEFRSGPFAPANVRSLIDTWSAQIEPLVVEASQTHDDALTVDEWRVAVDELIGDFVVPAEQEN